MKAPTSCMQLVLALKIFATSRAVEVARRLETFRRA